MDIPYRDFADTNRSGITYLVILVTTLKYKVCLFFQRYKISIMVFVEQQFLCFSDEMSSHVQRFFSGVESSQEARKLWVFFLFCFSISVNSGETYIFLQGRGRRRGLQVLSVGTLDQNMTVSHFRFSSSSAFQWRSLKGPQWCSIKDTIASY